MVVLRAGQRRCVESRIEAGELRQTAVPPFLVGDDQLLHGHRVARVAARQDHRAEPLERPGVVDVVQHRVDAPRAGVVDRGGRAAGHDLRWDVHCGIRRRHDARRACARPGATAATATERSDDRPRQRARHVPVQLDTARAPCWCRLTFRSPPRAREWISLEERTIGASPLRGAASVNCLPVADEGLGATALHHAAERWFRLEPGRGRPVRGARRASRIPCVSCETLCVRCAGCVRTALFRLRGHCQHPDWS